MIAFAVLNRLYTHVLAEPYLIYRVTQLWRFVHGTTQCHIVRRVVFRLPSLFACVCCVSKLWMYAFSILEHNNDASYSFWWLLLQESFPVKKVCFCLFWPCFYSNHIQYKGVYVMSSASSSDNNRSTGFRISSDEITAYSKNFRSRSKRTRWSKPMQYAKEGK